MGSNSRRTQMAVVLLAVAVSGGRVLAQREPADPKLTTLYTFTGSGGGQPVGGLVRGPNGALYGATYSSGGVVFQLRPPTVPGGTWTETVLHRFGGASDGDLPLAGLAFDRKGRLYGTTSGGGVYGYGTVFRLTPPAAAGAAWTEDVLYSFAGGNDGAYPESELVFSGDGVLYGSTFNGGAAGCIVCGTVFALKPPAMEGGAWTERILYRFPESGVDGQGPFGSLLRTNDGTLYGTTITRATGGGGYVFQLKPPTVVGGGWSESVLASFYGTTPPVNPSNLTFGGNGALYGSTEFGSSSNNGPFAGMIFVLTPPSTAGGAWLETVLYSFTGGADGFVPASIVLGKNGALYGTTEAGGRSGQGTVFILRPPTVAGGSWSETVLYSFTGGSDGWSPETLLIDSNGALYGTTGGADSNLGTVFRLTP